MSRTGNIFCLASSFLSLTLPRVAQSSSVTEACFSASLRVATAQPTQRPISLAECLSHVNDKDAFQKELLGIGDKTAAILSPTFHRLSSVCPEFSLIEGTKWPKIVFMPDEYFKGLHPQMIAHYDDTLDTIVLNGDRFLDIQITESKGHPPTINVNAKMDALVESIPVIVHEETHAVFARLFKQVSQSTGPISATPTFFISENETLAFVMESAATNMYELFGGWYLKIDGHEQFVPCSVPVALRETKHSPEDIVREIEQKICEVYAPKAPLSLRKSSLHEINTQGNETRKKVKETLEKAPLEAHGTLNLTMLNLDSFLSSVNKDIKPWRLFGNKMFAKSVSIVKKMRELRKIKEKNDKNFSHNQEEKRNALENFFNPSSH